MSCGRPSRGFRGPGRSRRAGLKTGVPALFVVQQSAVTGVNTGGLSRARLRAQDQFAGGGVALEEAVGLGGLGQGEFPVDGEAEFAAGDAVEDFPGAPLQLVRGRGVVAQGGPGDEEGSVLGKQQGVDRGHWSGRLAEQDEHSHAAGAGRGSSAKWSLPTES